MARSTDQGVRVLDRPIKGSIKGSESLIAGGKVTDPVIVHHSERAA